MDNGIGWTTKLHKTYFLIWKFYRNPGEKWKILKIKNMGGLSRLYIWGKRRFWGNFLLLFFGHSHTYKLVEICWFLRKFEFTDFQADHKHYLCTCHTVRLQTGEHVRHILRKNQWRNRCNDLIFQLFSGPFAFNMPCCTYNMHTSSVIGIKLSWPHASLRSVLSPETIYFGDPSLESSP